MRYGRLWLGLTAVLVGSFAVLIDFGAELYRLAPPIPDRVVTTDGTALFTGEDVKEGQNVWQSMGGQEVGSVWGHGAYVAPDWTADYLHRELSWILGRWAADEGAPSYEALDAETRAALRQRLKDEIRRNPYDPATGDLTVSPVRAGAMAAGASHSDALFGADPDLHELRDAYAIPADSIKTPERRAQLAAFFFWASWACSTERPGSAITCTNNWPAEELIENRPSGQIVVWSVVSFVCLLPGVGALTWAARPRGARPPPPRVPGGGPAPGPQPDPVDARDAQVLLRGDRDGGGAGGAGGGDGAPRGGGLGLLRSSAPWRWCGWS